MMFVVGNKRETPRKPTQTPFRPPRNPQGLIEMRTQDSSATVGGEHLTAYAVELPDDVVYFIKIYQNALAECPLSNQYKCRQMYIIYTAKCL